MPELTLGQRTVSQLQVSLGRGMTLRTGPFRFRIQSRSSAIAQGLSLLYADFPFEEDTGLRDFHVRLDGVTGPRRWYRPQVNFWLDKASPFKPLPKEHAFALLEWGMNWCIATFSHHYLLLHAAVLERRGQCVILPGEPGAGKSTLTNALLAAQVQDTGANRAGDNRGRHTTTVRSLHATAEGACIIDTPGLRTLRLDGDAQALGAVFEDIARLAPLCRFRDCRHEAEPGCAVREGVEAQRLRNFHKLEREARRDTLTALERRAQVQTWKQRSRAAKLRLGDKRGE